MIYIAGSLFTEAEISQRKKEGKLIRESLPEANVFNPIESEVNDKTRLPKSEDIFKVDYGIIKDSDYLLFNLDNESDAGVFMELGQALEAGKRNIYPVLSDIRMAQAGEYSDKYVPFGFNQYVIGALDYYKIKLFTNSEDAIKALVKDYKKRNK